MQYSKEEEARFLSHLDLMTAMERAFRRAQLPLAFSEGFNPHPRISYASALAVGVTSESEYLDLELEEEVAADVVLKLLQDSFPQGLKVLAVVPVTQRKESLMAIINMARYHVVIPLLQDILQQDVDKMINDSYSSEAWVVLRQGKKGERQVDIRPGVYSIQGRIEIEVVDKIMKNKLSIEMDVQTGSTGNVKPEEVLAILQRASCFPWEANVRVHRLGLFIREEDKIWSPLERS